VKYCLKLTNKKVKWSEKIAFKLVIIANFTGLENAFIASDDIEFPDGKKIPLWLFGFLY
jgi:hypothetical protein